MADYVPIFDPGKDITLTASATITAGQLVSVSGNNTVAPAAANEADWVGVATTDAASGAKVGISSGGVQELNSSGTINAGDLVVPAAAGAVAALAAVTTPTPADVTNTRAIVGIALAAAAGGKVRVKLER